MCPKCGSSLFHEDPVPEWLGFFRRLFRRRPTLDEGRKTLDKTTHGSLEKAFETTGDKLRVGMTYDEVVRLLGEPSGVNPGTEMLETGPRGVVVASEKTRAQLSSTKYCMWKRPEGRYLLIIEDGKLVKIYEKP
jgi:hypothetical protein